MLQANLANPSRLLFQVQLSTLAGLVILRMSEVNTSICNMKSITCVSVLIMEYN